MRTRKRLIVACSLLLGVATVAVAGYRIIGGPSIHLLDAIYMAVVTLSGVGYGEIIDTAHNHALRIFNIFIVLAGVAVAVYVFSQLTAFLVEGELRHLFRRSRMKKQIADLRQHLIVCGFGETGRHVTDELHKTHTPYVVIDSSNEAITRLVEGESDAYRDMLYLVGDATDEKVLERAGVDVAAGIVATLPSDKDNLVITVVVRQRNPAIRIVCRCTDLSFAPRMVKAGANSTVSPNHIGGLRMASEMLRPSVVGFLDLMLQEKSRTLRIEEILVGEKSSWLGSMISELSLGDRYNLLPLAIKGSNELGPQMTINPPSSTRVSSGTVIIVMGDTENLVRARADANP
ncbi:MAG: potassium channel protein [Candidatus Korobacteraceae bacterium]